MTVKIKKLLWTTLEYGPVEAKHAFGLYRIIPWYSITDDMKSVTRYQASYNLNTVGYVDTVEEAQKLCEEDHRKKLEDMFENV